MKNKSERESTEKKKRASCLNGLKVFNFFLDCVELVSVIIIGMQCTINEWHGWSGCLIRPNEIMRDLLWNVMIAENESEK